MARAHPPAWYPDPYDERRIRRWNGRAWTREVREVPPWIGTLRLAPGPPARRFGLRDRPTLVRRLWSASGVCLLLAVLLALSLPSALDAGDAERIDDRRYLAAVSRACDEANRSTFAPYRAAEVSDAGGLATALASFASELRAIDPPIGPDEDAVDRWIGRWELLARTGHRYVAALDAGERELAARLNEENLATRAEINRFAYANGLTSCLL